MIDGVSSARRRLWAVLAVAMLAWGSVPAQATAFGTFSFSQPTGTVGPNDAIRVRTTFTLDPTSVPLIVQNGILISGGFTDADYRANGINPAAVYDQYVTPTFSCNGDTFGACTTRPYFFSLPTGAGESVAFPQSFTLNPGASMSILLGVFLPNPGPVPADTYVNIGLSILVIAEGFVGPGHGSLASLLTETVAECPTCTFTRTVVDPNAAVPEPATWALMLIGFGAIGGAMRRRAPLRPFKR